MERSQGTIGILLHTALKRRWKEAVAIVAGDEAREPLQLMVEAHTKLTMTRSKDTRSFACDEANPRLAASF